MKEREIHELKAICPIPFPISQSRSYAPFDIFLYWFVPLEEVSGFDSCALHNNHYRVQLATHSLIDPFSVYRRD